MSVDYQAFYWLLGVLAKPVIRHHARLVLQGARDFIELVEVIDVTIVAQHDAVPVGRILAPPVGVSSGAGGWFYSATGEAC